MPNTILLKRGTTEPTAGVLSVGELAIDTTNGNAYTKLDDGTVSLLGSKASKLEIPIRNETGSTIPAGSAVYITGTQGNRPLVSLAQANTEATSSKTLGLTTTSILSGHNGYAILFGSLEKINTLAYTAGQALWLSATVAGELTATPPSAPNHAVFIGIVITSANNGKIEVRVANGYELEELHNVSITTPANGDFLGYDAGLWKNRTATQMGVPVAATSTEARFQTNSNKFLTPNTAHWMLMNPNIIQIQRAGFQVTNTGTISFSNGGWVSTWTRTGNVGACSSRWRTFGGSQVDQVMSMTDKANPASNLDFSNASWCSGRSALFGITESVMSWGFYHGKAEGDGVGILARRGYGWRATGNSGTRYLSLEVHNGTTLTSTASTYAITDGVAFDWDLISDGSGIVTLYVNGTQVATSTGGPTGSTNITPVVWQEEVATSAAAISPYNGMAHSRGKFIAFDP